MRICLPTAGQNGLKEKVNDHFGSAAYFVVYDTETKDLETISGNNQHSSHGSCQPLQAFADKNVDVVLTGGMGKRAVSLLNSSGVKVYKLEGDTVEEAIKKFESNQLTEIDTSGACQGHGCH